MRVLAPTAAPASPFHAPVEVPRLVAAEEGLELVGAGRRVALGALRLVSVVAAEVAGREEIRLLLFVDGETRPFLIPGHGIAYADFPIRRGFSVAESLRYFINHLVAEAPALAVTRHTQDYLRGGRPLDVDDESLPALTSGLAAALANPGVADAAASRAAGAFVCGSCGLKHTWPDACPRCGTAVGAETLRTTDAITTPPPAALPPAQPAVVKVPTEVATAEVSTPLEPPAAAAPVPAPTGSAIPATPFQVPARPVAAPRPYLVQTAQPSEAKVAFGLMLATAAVGLLRGVLLWGSYEALRPSTLYLVFVFFLPAIATIAVAWRLRAGDAWAYPVFLLISACGVGGLASLRAERLQALLAGLGGPLQALLTAAAALLLAAPAADRWLATRAGEKNARRLEIEPAGLLRGAVIAPLVLPVLAFLYIGVVGEQRALIPPNGMARAIVWMTLVGLPITYVLVWQGLLPAILFLRRHRLDRASLVLPLGLLGGVFILLLARGGHLPLSAAMVSATAWPLALLAGVVVAGLTWNSYSGGRDQGG